MGSSKRTYPNFLIPHMHPICFGYMAIEYDI
jgi:hypothetical protein